MCQALIDYFDKRSVLILGFGREGKSTLSFIRRHLPDKEVAIADRQHIHVEDDHIVLHTGENYLDFVSQYDLVMQSPGISLREIDVPASTEVSGQMDLFLRFAPCNKIGITGTKGKTTTTTLIYEIVKAAGIKCCLIGNMGVPVFDSLSETSSTTAVIEMSSHQLEFAKSSPHIAVLTNIYPEHLDHYNGFGGYVNAKANIVKYQNENDFFIYNPDQEELKQLIELESVKSLKLPVSINDGEKDAFLDSLTNINPKLKGKHNHQDIFFAVRAAKCIGISDQAIYDGIKGFSGIEHRMEEVGTWKRITFYNDSIATIPHAVLCAVEALEKVDTLIFGGMDRGIDYSSFIEKLSAGSVPNLIGLPETGHKIIHAMQDAGCTKHMFLADTMDEAVEHAYQVTAPEKICLFSPAASSYNRYKNFEEKGNHFKILCKTFGER